ncbi:Carbon-monoxide dehydrogenase (acceptor) [Pseudonocardia dioxanivorans CB1190]|uniref:Carbon-monoxide dehydrogenase (Acceptor) n=1 Tax=Pseudonocardia dioxanivorans (strain ATCC 55486 / DSM 44775 / JCM 13855 / CB1190) TaxID=675635 RepID=F4CPZ6_PSEUX|nr:FAD binding domain-containing protein [Pseudonocardia dioxanivorans]AEA27192.1 Carbon-monoxide dehydrogenase (acceptor) [Pseudonocardia dioxanivorans CB1190]
MKPGRFTYHAPRSVDEALAVLGQHAGDAKVLAGGQSLVPLLNFRVAEPGHLVDVNRLPGLSEPVRTATGWHVPALVRQRAVERSAALTGAFPLLGRALHEVAHPQIRNRGTLCGSLAHADAAAELPAVVTALDGRLRIASPRGERTVAAADFFVFHLTTALEDDELLLGVDLDDLPAGTTTSFHEFAGRRGDFALAAVAGQATRDTRGVVTRCRLVAAGVAGTPLRLRAAEDVLLGARLDDSALAAATRAAAREARPTGDVHASAGYRRDLVGTLTRRVLADIAAAVPTEELTHA